MTIEQSDKIDVIGQDKSEGYISLTISDHLEWDDENEKLLTLQEKINTYLTFIESGQIFDDYPSAQGNKIRITLCCKYEPNKEGLNFLSRVSPTIEEAGFKFNWEVLNDN